MAVYKRAGLKAKLSPRPTLRALSIADRGIADAEVGHTEEIMKNYPNLIKVDAQLFTFFGRAYALKPEIQSFKKEDLKKYRTGVKRGSYWDQEFIKGIPVTKVESCNQLFDILMAGRIDIGLCPDGVFNNQSNEQREKHKNIRAIGPPIVALPMYHYVHKKNKHLIPLLEKTIREMVTDGSIDPTRSWLK
jgi:ABC-type amino acid transport substrate-binding protein